MQRGLSAIAELLVVHIARRQSTNTDNLQHDKNDVVVSCYIMVLLICRTLLLVVMHALLFGELQTPYFLF